MTTTNPTLLKMPLARDGDKTAIPETAGSTTGNFSQQYGFQEINQLPLGAGGIAPKRNDFNGVFNLLSGLGFFAQKGWTFHYDSTQDYYLGCVVIDPADGKRYECIADMAAGDNAVAPHEDEDNTYWRRFTLGDGVPIATILAYSSNGDIPSGYLLCDGSAVSRTMFPDLFSAIGTIYGSGDGSTTFNLPDYNTAARFAQGGTVAGTEIAAGLPNITGTLIPTITISNSVQATGISGTGAFYDNNPSSDRSIFTSTNGSRHLNTRVVLDASRSSSIYGNSDTVQPPALTCRYIIKAFDGQTADSALIDITQYAQELAGKANITGSNLVHHKDVITTSGTYTAPVTGLYKITVKGGGGGGQSGTYTSSIAAGGAGGMQGYKRIEFIKLIAGDGISCVIGAGGAGATHPSAGGGGQNPGSRGGTSSVTINGTTYSASGGLGGGQSVAFPSYDDNTIPGFMGEVSNYSTATGSTAYGGRGGGEANWYGSGGAGGSARINTTIADGFAGNNGAIFIEYYTPGA